MGVKWELSRSISFHALLLYGVVVVGVKYAQLPEHLSVSLVNPGG